MLSLPGRKQEMVDWFRYTRKQREIELSRVTLSPSRLARLAKESEVWHSKFRAQHDRQIDCIVLEEAMFMLLHS